MKKMIVPLLAAIVAVSLSAFTPAHRSVKPSGVLYWYQTDPTGTKIPAGTPLYDHAQKQDVNTDCNDEGMRDCLRGFTTPQNTSSDIFASGTEQIRYSPQE